MRALLARVRAVLNPGRLMHYADIFVAASFVFAVGNYTHLLGAHGVDAYKSFAFAALAAGGKAVIEMYRKAHAKPAVAASTPFYTTNTSSSSTVDAMVNLAPARVTEPPAEPPAKP